LNHKIQKKIKKLIEQNTRILYTLFSNNFYNPKENDMTWETPTAIDLRFGFEITMYIANR